MRYSLRRGGVVVDLFVVSTVVAAGVMVAGITNNPPAEVDAIPGCAEVLQAGEGFSFAIGFYGGATYDNPDYPWLTAPKATAMSNALVSSLPDAAELVYSPPSWSLIFQPMDVYPQDASLPDGVKVADISGDSRAKGSVLRGDVEGELSVSVEASDVGVLPCIEGRVDERVTLPSGVVVDAVETVSESESESESVATHQRMASAYTPDTVISARLTDREKGGVFPLTIEELRNVVANPGLRVGAPVAPGTPAPRADCGTPRENPVPPLPREVVDRVGAALTEAWTAAIPATRTDRPIGDLLPGRFGSGSACNAIEVTTQSGTSQIEVEIRLAGRNDWSDPDVSSVPGRTRTSRPDGTVVTTYVADPRGRTPKTDVVTVLRPSNTLVQFTVTDGFDLASLAEVGVAPELDL